MREPGTDKTADDARLVSAVLAGDPEAFAPLVRSYQAPLRRYCEALLRDHAAAEDAAQQAFVKAYRNLSRLRKKEAFQHWLFRLARNHCFDLLRKKGREGLQQLPEQEGQIFSATPGQQELAPALEGALSAREELAALFAELSAEHREVLLLREGFQESYEGMATVLGISVNAVKGRLKRARKRAEDYWRHKKG